MKNKLKKIFEGKSILILGFGREGQSTFKLLREYFPEMKLTISDRNEIKVNCNKTEIITGDNYLENLLDFDLIIKTPGIPMTDMPKDIAVEKISSQTDIFLSLFSSQIIGVTGTKGKSTTSSLIYHIISQHTDNVILVGNIGIPPFNLIDKINENTKIVYELSSHQLANVHNSPHIAVLLNLFQEHLDYFKTFENYQLAKFNITKFQNKDDYFIFFNDSHALLRLLRKFYKPVNYFSYSLKNITDNGCFKEKTKIYFTKDGKVAAEYPNIEEYCLKGNHNMLNVMVAIICAEIIQIPEETITKALKSFKTLRHRLEYVGEFNEVKYFNDSIATIPEATIEALKTLVNVDTLILGGFDRGIDYRHLIKFLISNTVSNLIFIGNAGKRILNEYNDYYLLTGLHLSERHLYEVNNLKQAVDIAKQHTRKNSICLLSPAAASYGMFKDFEDRGDTFIQLVKG